MTSGDLSNQLRSDQYNFVKFNNCESCNSTAVFDLKAITKKCDLNDFLAWLQITVHADFFTVYGCVNLYKPTEQLRCFQSDC